jgi:hypothetical protein
VNLLANKFVLILPRIHQVLPLLQQLLRKRCQIAVGVSLVGTSQAGEIATEIMPGITLGTITTPMVARKLGQVKSLDHKGANLSPSIVGGLMNKTPMGMVTDIIVPDADILNLTVPMMAEHPTSKADDMVTVRTPVVVDRRTLTFRIIVLLISGMFAMTTTMSPVEWLLLITRRATILQCHFRIKVRQRHLHSKMPRLRRR